MSAGGHDGGQVRRQRTDRKGASPDRKRTKESEEKACVEGHVHAAKELHSLLAVGVGQTDVWTKRIGKELDH